jgi:hypothetical protein
MDPGPTKDRRTLLEERLLTLSFQHDPTILKKRNVSKSIKFPLNRRILDEYISYTNAGKKYDPAEFAAAIPKELVAGYTDILLMELGGVDMQNNDAVEREIEFIISELSLVDIKGKLEKVAKNIKTLEDAGEIKKLQKEEKKFNKLTHILSKLEDNKVEGIILK